MNKVEALISAVTEAVLASEYVGRCPNRLLSKAQHRLETANQKVAALKAALEAALKDEAR